MELKFDPGFQVIRKYLSQIDLIMKLNWIDIILKLNWLDIESQFEIDSILKSNWFDIASQFEIVFQYRVNLTRILSNYSEFRVEFYLHHWLNFLGQNESFFLLV